MPTPNPLSIRDPSTFDVPPAPTRHNPGRGITTLMPRAALESLLVSLRRPSSKKRVNAPRCRTE